MGPFMIDVAGTSLTKEDITCIKNPLVGGVILFSRNVDSPAQIKALCHEIRRCRKSPLLIAVDQEGGRVRRFRDGFHELPPARLFGEVFDESPRKAEALASACGYVMAMECLAVGVDLSFAPVLDVDHGKSLVIGDRAFHSNPEVIAQLAGAFIDGMHHAGMAAVGKHFPGHGWVTADTHKAIAEDTRPAEDIMSVDMLPFQTLIAQGKLKGIMPAHVQYPSVDEHPAGFSPFWLQQILRQQMQFSGAIFTDDLSMTAAVEVGSLKERVHKALRAGCDELLLCNHREGVLELLAAFKGRKGKKLELQEDSPARLKACLGKRRPDFAKLKTLPDYTTAIQVLNRHDIGLAEAL